jgi:hypothetical protein
MYQKEKLKKKSDFLEEPVPELLSVMGSKNVPEIRIF